MNSFSKQLTLTLLLAILGTFNLQAQITTQTVRGTIKDIDSNQPLFGATVVVINSDPLLGGTTDMDGRFNIPNVPTGRIDLQIRMLGYEELTLPNILVNSAKESVLKVNMQESVIQMKQVEIVAEEKKEELQNDMVMVSGRRISVEETSRIAGSFNDPARMVGTFPGVANDPAGDNDIVVRGNSPRGVLWRLEGVEIPNPNHFSDEGRSGGPINVLNSDMLDDSEFYTGAFSPEYGNAYTAVFDMKLRDGNDEKREYALKVGVLGTDITAEGPMPGKNGGSYLFNYRYSSLALLDDAGIVDFQGVPKYTDASFKIKKPTSAGTFSLWGLGGISTIDEKDEENDTIFSQGTFGSRMGVIGLNHTKMIGKNSFLFSSLTLSGNDSKTDYQEPRTDEDVELMPRYEDDLNKWTTRFATVLNNKLNARHKLRSGIIVSHDKFRMQNEYWDEDEQRMITELDSKGEATTLQAFTSWKWRWNEEWTLTSGVHYLHYFLNNSQSVEPRLGMRYQFRPNKAFTFGAGLHAKTESVTNYLAQAEDEQGNIIQPNKDMDLTRSAHFVLGYEQMLGQDIQLKAEAYYQHLYNMPVENDPTSSFSLHNYAGWFTTDPLVNKGTGYNYGLELSVEKFFTRNYNFLVTASLFDSKYTALDGVERNSRYNLGYVANVLGGKEWQVGKNGKDRVISASLKFSLVGGQHYTPIDLDASIAAGEEEEVANSWGSKAPAVTKLDVVLAYRINRPKASHEFKADVQNVLGNDSPVYFYYDEDNKNIEEVPQMGMLPVLQYTLRF